MNKRMIMLMVAALALLSASGQVTFSGVGQYDVYEVTPERTTGLDKIYVLYNTQGVEMAFKSSTGERATWESFFYHDGNLIMEPVSGVRWDGLTTKLNNITPNIGYMIQEGNNSPYYCWVVNYADYMLELNDMIVNNESSCSLITLNIDGHAEAIPFYSIDGHRHVLDREIKLEYKTQVWDDSLHWQDQYIVENFAYLNQNIEIVPPLCDTHITLSGDRFLEWWNDKDSCCVYNFQTHAVACGANAVLVTHQGNEEKLEGGLSAGSAPVRVVFTGYPIADVVFREWEIASDEDFENVLLQFNQNEVDYTFNDPITYYVRYHVANADGSCEAYSDVYTIAVSVSEVMDQSLIPNVFTPGGAYPYWGVKTKSLVDFHCWIYNRWGTLIYEFTDPDGYWDGTYNGSYVDTGVYYYVLTAVGSDGQSHQRRGDITVLRYNGSGESNPNMSTSN